MLLEHVHPHLEHMISEILNVRGPMAHIRQVTGEGLPAALWTGGEQAYGEPPEETAFSAVRKSGLSSAKCDISNKSYALSLSLSLF